MTLKVLVTASILLAAGTILPCRAQIVSDFSTGIDGWTAGDLSGGSNPVINYITTGNPGGALSTSWSGSAVMYWSAPSKFLGNVAYTSLGMTLSFDVETNGSPIGHGASGDIMIQSTSNQTMYANLTTLPTGPSVWTHMSIALDETADWKSGGITGSTLSRPGVIDILSNVAAIRIFVTWKSSATSGVIGGLDNVVMGVHPAIPVGPMITSLSSTSANKGSNITITGNNFGANTSNNVVMFGGVKGNIVSATSTSVVVTVPTAADYGPVTIINTTTGLSAASQQKFIPTSVVGGGRILKGSFMTDVLYNKTVGFISHGDLNGDGRAEMFTADDNVISVFENVSTPGSITSSSFATRIDMDPSLVSFYGEIGANDLDGDGKLDLFFALRDNPDQGRIGVLRNIHTSGAITGASFATIEEFNVPVYTAISANAADIDGDGRPELIGWGGSCATNPLYILPNISRPGDIQFTAPISFTGSNSCQGRYWIADIDGDGKPDVVETTGSNTRIFRNTSVIGSISFETGFDLGDGGNVGAIGDLDNDGKPDIVYANGGMKIYKNISTPGTLTTASFATPVTFVGATNVAKIADINGDGKPDVVVGTTAAAGVYQNVSIAGQINTSSFLPVVPIETRHGAGEIDIFDVDVDGLPDIISNNSGGGNISINQNVIRVPPTIINIHPTQAQPGATIQITGTNFSTVASENTVYFAGAKATVSTASATSLEVLVPAGATYDQVSVAVDGFTVFSQQFFTPVFSGGHSFAGVDFATGVDLPLTGNISDGLSAMDYDGDGKIDLLTDNGSVTIGARNVGTDGVIDATTFGSTYTAASQGSHVKGNDLDGDGQPDITTTTYIFRNASSSVLPNPITFESQTTRDNNPGVTRLANSRDLNNDGKIEVIFTSAGSSIYFDENQTRFGSFVGAVATFESMTTVVTIPKPAGNGSIAVADIDGDGFNDIVATNPNTDNFTAYLNAGKSGSLSTASFNTGTNFSTGDNPYGIVFLDFDGDNKLNVAVTNFINGATASVSVYRNVSSVGNINFTRQDFQATAGPTAIVAADMDGDGKPDLVVINETSNSFSVFRNKSTTGVLDANSFETKVDYAVGSSPRGLTVADIDRDMRPDVIVTRTTATVSIFKNLVPKGPSISFVQQPVNKTACENGVAAFTDVATGASNITYQWQLFNNSTSAFEDVPGAGSGTLTLNGLTVLMNGNTYRCRVNGTGATEKTSDPAILSVTASPAPPTTSNASACKGSSLVLTAGGSIDGLYRWFDSPTSQPISNEVNSTFTTPVIFNSTTYYAAISDANGCVSSRTAAVATITPLTKPVITSNGTLLCGVNQVAISGPAGFSEYNWSNGESTQNINVSFSGSYSLIVADVNGCQSLPSDPMIITAGSVAKPVIDASKDRLCSADDQVILTAPAGFTGYEWSNGATTQSVNVTEVGTYNVIVTNNSGCRSETSDDFKVSEGAIKPIISVGNNVLASTPAKTYQWYFSDYAIPDATKQFLDFNPFQYGAYMVQVTDLSGCAASSDVFVNLVTGLGDEWTADAVYPNPFEDMLSINITTDEATLLDTTGKEIQQLRQGENNVSSLSHGLYFVRIKNGNEFKIIKVIK